MKFPPLALVLCPCLLGAAVPPWPSFAEKLAGLPDLSLSETVKSWQLPFAASEAKATAEWFRCAGVPREKRYVSRMPVIEPAENIDRYMPLLAPKSDLDCKMNVRVPNVDSLKG